MKSLLLYSDDAWNNDRTDNFTNATVKKESDLSEDERETFYPCSMYFEVGATDDTGYETLKIDEQDISFEGEDFKMFVITMKGPTGDIITQNFPNPTTIDCSKYEWAQTGFGGDEGDTVRFCLTGVETSNKIDRKKIEDFISNQIANIRGDEEEEEDSEAEFYPVGEGRILGDITSTTEYQPFANAEEMASEYSVERINPTAVSGSQDVRAETFASEGSCTKCAETFAACGCENAAETMNNETNPEVADVSLWDDMSMPEGTGNIIGQATPETDYTPFGVSAEDFEAQGYDDKLDESLGMSHKESGMKQDDKDRRDESAGMEKSRGRRKYARVGTMDKDDRYGADMFASGMKTYASHAVPLGIGSVMGQATADTDFTAFGTRAENFNAERSAVEGYWGATIDSLIQDLERFKMSYGGNTPVSVRSGIGWSGVGNYEIGFQEYTTTKNKLLSGEDEYDTDREEIRAAVKNNDGTALDALAIVKQGYDSEYVSAYGAENFDAEQVVPFGVVGSGNDFGQNLAEDFGAETIISQDEWEDFYEVQMSGRMNMMYHWNIRKFMADDNYDKAKKWFQEDGNTEDLVIKGAEDFGAESKYGMWTGLGLALLAGIGAKMALDRMDKKDEAPDSEEPTEESDEAPEE